MKLKTACERFSSKGKEGGVIKISVKAHIHHTLKVVVRMVAMPFALGRVKAEHSFIIC